MGSSFRRKTISICRGSYQCWYAEAPDGIMSTKDADSTLYFRKPIQANDSHDRRAEITSKISKMM